MHHHRLTVSYKGTYYYGWQDIAEGEEKPTIERNIQKVLQHISKSPDCTIATASRTDAGVHAQGQVIKVSIPLAIDSKKLLLGMNSLLADDIRILDCTPSTKAFNPNKDSKSKEYHYSFCTDSIHNPILNDSVAHITSQKPLNIILMQEACKLFVGEHDFYCFAKRDSTMHSTLRTVLSCELVLHTSSLAATLYSINIVGEGFLRYMVRYMVGALFALGKGEIELSDIVKALTYHNEEKLSAKVKARGLCLMEVSY
jgi:tRNA pseudouridine38-40 synthase